MHVVQFCFSDAGVGELADVSTAEEVGQFPVLAVPKYVDATLHIGVFRHLKYTIHK